MNRAPNSSDPFTAEIVRNGLTAAAVEMSKTLARTAHSTLLYDVQDFGVGILDDCGAVWGEAPGISLFTGCLSEIVQHGVARIGRDGYDEGDVLIVNDPYLTGSHLSDVSIYMPIFHDRELVAFAVSTAHWADVGAKVPGGWCPDSTDVYQEGVCYSHLKLHRRGHENPEIMAMITDNVRLPETVKGDLEAQIAACRRGADRVRAVCEKYTTNVVRTSMAAVIERTEAAMRRQIGSTTDGIYAAELCMDSDGVTLGAHPILAVTLTIHGDQLTASFAGSSAATKGPINLPAVGSRGAIRVAIKALLMPYDRTNDGHFRWIDIDLPEGLIVSPQRPSPCDSFGYINGAIGQLVIRALGPVFPDTASAGGLQLLAVFLSRVDGSEGEPFMFIEPIHGGNGASPDQNGATIARFADGDASNTAAEVIELRYPLRCERFELRPEAAGAGRMRGGCGVRRDYRVLEDGVFLQTANENTIDRLAKGCEGGRDGLPSEVAIHIGTDREEVLERRVSNVGPLAIGDVISLRSGGGGGWGDPFERNPTDILAELRNGLLTQRDAIDVYAVSIKKFGDSWEVDEADTAALRSAREGGSE